MVSAATLETDKEPDLYNDNDIEPDFHPILAATVNPVAMNEQESKSTFLMKRRSFKHRRAILIASQKQILAQMQKILFIHFLMKSFSCCTVIRMA